jgi:TonB family protein
MTTSIAVVENQKIGFEPTEITYRTIFYYLDASIAKMIQPGAAPSSEQQRGNPPSVQLPSASMSKVSSFATVQLPGANLSNSSNSQRVNVGNDGEAPAPRILKPVSGGVLNGKALNLPVPVYPSLALRARTVGKVEVEVTVDENGKVISAQATSGPVGLRDAAVDAAKRARFSPTRLSGAPVKVVGFIYYNFTLP